MVLNTLEGKAWATLSGRLQHGGPSQHTQRQRRREKQAGARVTQEGTQSATAEATASEDATEKDGHNRSVEKVKKMLKNYLLF